MEANSFEVKAVKTPRIIMKKIERNKDLFLVVFWGTAYLLKAMVEIPYLWVKSLFSKK